jgi:hypothetical protein
MSKRGSGVGRPTSFNALAALPNRVVRGVERRTRGGRLPSAPDHQRASHELLRVAWPCVEQDEFRQLWPSVLASLSARGLEIGRGSYGGWDDADPALAATVWCVTRHLRPRVVVETGVARGLTARLVLEALQRNGGGQLWSVDLPPKEPGLADQTGAAVPPQLRDHWTLLLGASRDRLPGLAGELSARKLPIGLFIHDSLHTGRNVRFELDWVWPRLAADGVAIVDDVEQNAAFAAFTGAHPEARAVVCEAADGRSQFGCLQRPRPA